MKNHIAIAAIVFAVLWLFRWQLVPSSQTDTTAVYQLDRWTGNVTLLAGTMRLPIVDKK